jgi:methionyl-tRNA formyltransferase
MRIAFLASGDLGLSTLIKLSIHLSPSIIATDSNSYGIIQFAKQNGIPCFVGNPRNGRLYTFLNGSQYDLILSVNYLFIVELDVIESSTYAINIHGSLLPKYRGRTPHVWAIINNETKTGITAHFMEKKYDCGGIILQKEIDIDYPDTGASILSKFETLYPGIIIEIISMIHNNELKGTEQDNSKATIFGKRVPEDGRINWNWQKERIYNWVRAMAFPYPGAFSKISNHKVIIDSVLNSEVGFSENMPNGLILKDKPSIIVKTSNGALELSSVRSNIHLLKTGEILS